nr:hypothetical protein [Rhodococcus sp. IEGM 1351]MDI9936589.1 hypothetical protein [Rhodococcus sp. IEGM 1351]
MGIDQGSNEFRRRKDGYQSFEQRLDQARRQREEVKDEISRRLKRKRGS